MLFSRYLGLDAPWAEKQKRIPVTTGKRKAFATREMSQARRRSLPFYHGTTAWGGKANQITLPYELPLEQNRRPGIPQHDFRLQGRIPRLVNTTWYNLCEPSLARAPWQFAAEIHGQGRTFFHRYCPSQGRSCKTWASRECSPAIAHFLQGRVMGFLGWFPLTASPPRSSAS